MMLIGMQKLAAKCALAVVLLLIFALVGGSAASFGSHEAGGVFGGGPAKISLASRQRRKEGGRGIPTTRRAAGAGGQERRWVMKDRRRGPRKRPPMRERSNKRHVASSSARGCEGDGEGRGNSTTRLSNNGLEGEFQEDVKRPPESLPKKTRVVLHPRKLCADPECELLASFGPANATAFFATHCSKHQLPGHRNIRDKLCQHMEVRHEPQHIPSPDRL